MSRDDPQNLHGLGLANPALSQPYEKLPLRKMPASRLAARHQHLLREIGRSTQPRAFALHFALNRRRVLAPLVAALVGVLPPRKTALRLHGALQEKEWRSRAC